jgi:hypothetical protein
MKQRDVKRFRCKAFPAHPTTFWNVFYATSEFMLKRMPMKILTIFGMRPELVWEEMNVDSEIK